MNKQFNPQAATVQSLRPWWYLIVRDITGSGGWMLPMVMVMSAGVMMPLAMMLDWFPQQPVVQNIGLSVWCTFALIGAATSAIVAWRSIRHAWRLGFRGAGRPRFWFEISRCLWMTSTYCLLVALCLPLLVRKFPIPFLLVRIAILAASASIACFLLSATLAQILSFSRRQPRAGRAFVLVHSFYMMSVGFGLFVCAGFMWWPPMVIWPDGFLLAVVSAIGMGLLVGGIIFMAKRTEQAERRQNEGSSIPTANKNSDE